MTATFDIESIAAELRALQRAAAHGAVTVVVPLAEGRAEVVREFLAEGPPFDPQVTGLTRHDVFLTDREVVFLFEAEDAHALERILAEPELWDVVAAWEHNMAGPPRFGGRMYAWPEHPADDA